MMLDENLARLVDGFDGDNIEEMLSALAKRGDILAKAKAKELAEREKGLATNRTSLVASLKRVGVAPTISENLAIGLLHGLYEATYRGALCGNVDGQKAAAAEWLAERSGDLVHKAKNVSANAKAQAKAAGRKAHVETRRAASAKKAKGWACENCGKPFRFETSWAKFHQNAEGSTCQGSRVVKVE